TALEAFETLRPGEGDRRGAERGIGFRNRRNRAYLEALKIVGLRDCTARPGTVLRPSAGIEDLDALALELLPEVRILRVELVPGEGDGIGLRRGQRQQNVGQRIFFDVVGR